jgi:hypothetical protein
MYNVVDLGSVIDMPFTSLNLSIPDYAKMLSQSQYRDFIGSSANNAYVNLFILNNPEQWPHSLSTLFEITNMNSKGTAVGVETNAGDEYLPFISKASNNIDAGDFPNTTTKVLNFKNVSNFFSIWPTAVNDNNMMIGTYLNQHGNYQGFAYQIQQSQLAPVGTMTQENYNYLNVNDSIIKLNDLIPKNLSSTISITLPVAIDSAGNILAFGTVGEPATYWAPNTDSESMAGEHLFILTPQTVAVPEPSTFFTLAFLGGSLLINRRKSNRDSSKLY